jgi:hypothetical protein
MGIIRFVFHVEITLAIQNKCVYLGDCVSHHRHRHRHTRETKKVYSNKKSPNMEEGRGF